MTETYLEPQDVQAMESAARCVRDLLMIRMLFRLGCRESELIGILRGDVDRKAQGVRIAHSKQRLKLHCPQCDARLGRQSVFCQRCGTKVEQAVIREMEQRRVRFLTLDEETLAMLTDYLDHTRGGQGDPVFPVSRWRVIGVVKECARRAGLGPLVNPDNGRRRGISPHRLRDALAVHALKTDDSATGMRLLQEQLGHQRFDTTARYRKVAGEELAAWREKLWASS